MLTLLAAASSGGRKKLEEAIWNCERTSSCFDEGVSMEYFPKTARPRYKNLSEETLIVAIASL